MHKKVKNPKPINIDDTPVSPKCDTKESIMFRGNERKFDQLFQKNKKFKMGFSPKTKY